MSEIQPIYDQPITQFAASIVQAQPLQLINNVWQQMVQLATDSRA